MDGEEDSLEGRHRSSNMSSNLSAAAAAASTNANMSAKIAAAFNQGFSTLGGRLGNNFYFLLFRALIWSTFSDDQIGRKFLFPFFLGPFPPDKFSSSSDKFKSFVYSCRADIFNS